jgi:hypothetical protein
MLGGTWRVVGVFERRFEDVRRPLEGCESARMRLEGCGGCWKACGGM